MEKACQSIRSFCGSWSFVTSLLCMILACASNSLLFLNLTPGYQNCFLMTFIPSLVKFELITFQTGFISARYKCPQWARNAFLINLKGLSQVTPWSSRQLLAALFWDQVPKPLTARDRQRLLPLHRSGNHNGTSECGSCQKIWAMLFYCVCMCVSSQVL